jgi:hypothetical protein
MNNDRKLIKVITEYDNGDKEYIEGDDAENWDDALNGAVMLDFTHGGRAQEVLKNITWKTLTLTYNRN